LTPPTRQELAGIFGDTIDFARQGRLAVDRAQRRR